MLVRKTAIMSTFDEEKATRALQRMGQRAVLYDIAHRDRPTSPAEPEPVPGAEPEPVPGPSRPRPQASAPIQPNATPDNLFQEPVTVFENDRLKIVVKRKAFQRQKKFDLEDVLFEIKVTSKKWRKTAKPPLILNILENLFHALVRIIDELKIHYADESHRQLYVTGMLYNPRHSFLNLK